MWYRVFPKGKIRSVRWPLHTLFKTAFADWCLQFYSAELRIHDEIERGDNDTVNSPKAASAGGGCGCS